jgi:hypothetical protein
MDEKKTRERRERSRSPSPFPTATRNGYLSKPIEPEAFVAQIEAYLPAELRRTRPSKDG